MKKLGTKQLEVLYALASHGHWQYHKTASILISWLYDSPKGTKAIMDRLVELGLATVEPPTSKGFINYYLTEAGNRYLEEHSGPKTQ
jgi:DNA-binding MarR family transcriptional regulator